MNLLRVCVFFLVCASVIFMPFSHADERPPWPKVVKELLKSDFVAFKDHSKLPAGIKTYGPYGVPHIAKWDLDFDGEPELIVSHHGLASTSGPRHYVYKKKGSEYVSIGYLDQTSKVVILEPFEGYAQLELWTPGGDGGDPTFARRLVRINKERKFIHYRIDTFRPGDDGKPIYLSTYYFTDGDIKRFAEREN